MTRKRLAPHRDAASWIREYVGGCDSPDVRAYAGELGERISARFLWFLRYLIRLGKLQDCTLLDVGCGFGWNAVAVSLLGNNHVVANDVRASMTDVVAERVAAIRSQGAPVSVETLTGDICSLDIPAASYDGIICNETIEHVHDLPRMFDVCHAALKPGSRMVVTNDNNVFSAERLSRAHEMWRKRDSSWEYIEELRHQRPIENRDIKPYAVMREEIVRRARPDLAPDAVAAVVRATAGMIEPEIDRVARTYAARAALPEPPELSWCRNPITGEYCERLLDPYEIRDLMRETGFTVGLYHAFRRLPLRFLNGVGVRWLNRRLFQLRPLFVLVGCKPQR